MPDERSGWCDDGRRFGHGVHSLYCGEFRRSRGLSAMAQPLENRGVAPFSGTTDACRGMSLPWPELDRRPPYPAEFRQQVLKVVHACKTPIQLSREFEYRSRRVDPSAPRKTRLERERDILLSRLCGTPLPGGEETSMNDSPCRPRRYN